MTTQSGTETTRFGAIESHLRESMETPVKGRIIVRVDTLVPLKELWGVNILMARDPVYSLVSGNVSDEKYRDILTSYYTRFYSFANYVDEKFLFEPDDIPLIRRLVEPVRKIIDTYAQNIVQVMTKNNGTLVLRSHDYLYFYFKRESVPRVEECKFIC